MKCIECGTHSIRRQRWKGRCPKCRHTFAFEPATDPARITDGAFKLSVERVSGGGAVRFTARNLWYEVHRRRVSYGPWRQKYSIARVTILATLPVLLLAMSLEVEELFLLAGVVFVAMAAWRNYKNWREFVRWPPPQDTLRVEFGVFCRQHLLRWVEVYGPIPGLLPAREEAAASMPREVPADVAAFSFDRAVVTDTWETAQVLVANRFHFEHNCAVLSVDGYPDGIADTVKEMLRRNPRLTVFALHDASVEGCQLPLRLREAAWFPDPRVRIVDLGLRPYVAKGLRLPELKGPAAHGPGLEKVLLVTDQKWLAAGHFSELAALTPTQLMRAVYKGIVAAGDGSGVPGAGGDSGGGGSYYGSGVIWVGDLSPGGDPAVVDGFG